ncbi:hypothetical protein LMG6000_06635 [Achromobacter insolitus]|uniref:RadC-like JAB domain-containing protein n=1 Tax=Achromobacter insolitus TaxID=217204 RepID=A0A6S7FB89_9BURK|nr:JAB domain-containing protein [Achromobacter insolitus]CAB3940793.1 hypothetical protein LMG6000_06635 [Achromobacter insolitus]
MQLSFSSAWAGERQVPQDVQGAPVVCEAGGLYRAATPEELLRAAALQLEGALGSRLPVDKPSAAIDYIVTRLALSDVEVFGVMFLDAQLRMIAFEEMFRGTLSETSVYPREVVKAAIRHNAHSILMVHYVARNIMGVMCPVFLCGRALETWHTAMVSKHWLGT